MIPKSMFFCTTCQENRYGEVVQQATSFGNSLVRVCICATCNKTSIEKLPTQFSVNKYNNHANFSGNTFNHSGSNTL